MFLSETGGFVFRPFLQNYKRFDQNSVEKLKFMMTLQISFFKERKLNLDYVKVTAINKKIYI